MLSAIANAEKLEYLQKHQKGEKTGKVSLLRDIDFNNPHAGHLKILHELNIHGKTVEVETNGKKKKITDFKTLTLYWQSVFNVSILNKKFYKELSDWFFWAKNMVTFPDDLPELKDELNQSY